MTPWHHRHVTVTWQGMLSHHFFLPGLRVGSHGYLCIHLSLQNSHCVTHNLGWSLTGALQLGGMPRKSSTIIGFPKNPSTSTSNTLILVHKTTESNVIGSSSPQQHHSIQTLGSSASPQQKIVQVLVNRLNQKVNLKWLLVYFNLNSSLYSYLATQVFHWIA